MFFDWLAGRLVLRKSLDTKPQLSWPLESSSSCLLEHWNYRPVTPKLLKLVVYCGKIDLSNAHRSRQTIALCSSIHMFGWIYGSPTLFQSDKQGRNAHCPFFYGTVTVTQSRQAGWDRGAGRQRWGENLGKPWSLSWRFKEQMELVLLGNYKGKEPGTFFRGQCTESIQHRSQGVLETLQ